MKSINRRQFLQISGATTALVASNLGFSLQSLEANTPRLRIAEARETTSICCFCSCGCGLLCHTKDGQLINVEGDPDNPVNRGTNCSKGAAAFQKTKNDQRVTHVLYRAPGSTQWEQKSWDWALEEIAQRVVATRDDSMVHKNSKNVIVNRTEAIASLGSSMLNNEDLYLISKLMRSLGVVNIEHQARLCHSSTVAGLAATFGRGAMTNTWVDLKNTDCALIIGSNAAENHPLSFKWLMEAREKRGAKIIHLDPRFTRTSARSDYYAPFRSGTDIALFGGFFHYIFETGRYHHDYVLHYTNASYLVHDDYDFEDGLFSGFDEAEKSYDKSSWAYQRGSDGQPLRDMTLQHPRSVFQMMKKHYSRYDADTVSSVTGMPKEKFLQVAELFTETAHPGKTGTILYAMGSTQHTVGAQNCRCMSMLQLLLGNIGRPGGGLNALRGHSNVQGSTDMACLYHLLPGYLPAPNDVDHADLALYNATTPSDGYWTNRPKFLASLLKAWWGEQAQRSNDFAYHYLPKQQKGYNHSHIGIFEDMLKGIVQGLFVWGQNPAVAGPNSSVECKALEKLKWLVQVDLFDNETSSFWKRPGARSEDIETEVFLLPAASFMEKEGSLTHSGRVIQYRWQAVQPKGDSRPESWILDQLARKIKEHYEESPKAQDEPLRYLTWNYGDSADQVTFVDAVAREINGKEVSTGAQLKGFGELKEDGTTSCGNWIYSGYHTGDQNNSKKREQSDPSGLGFYPEWGFAWPANRRILYNRANCDPSGQAWSEEKKTIWWNSLEGRWVGYDVPDFPATRSPEETGGKSPFIMLPEGHGRLFAVNAMNEGPFPEHYEPYESPVSNLLSSVSYNPVIKIWDHNEKGDADQYPVVCSTWRVCEHWHTGSTTRNMPWLAELMPALFAEIPPSLAKKRGIKNGDKIEVLSARGKIEAAAMVTERIQPLHVNGQDIEQIGLAWCFGYQGLVKGDITNTLSPHVGDANTTIPEYKAFLVDVRKVK
ncbi:formate dehydrogenase-N subunit alpha [Heliorestis convoluta]|uniref:Formate dehydrogenase, alpha subunit n=1 Tax=Heliorestis convoluta TaxID=356322 RepID=A0A5Q2MZ65_9FIRM|nr:formate dehydrogenase-N subunit alpha [Heliorestis convoluta]QGG46733.1 formate dehydrogenase, alpha subunit [Heliorestis convoluta]